jgi:hypothetical protein
LERKKSELRAKVRESQTRLAQRAQWYAGEMARLAQQQSLEMLQEQSRLSQVERQLDKLSEAQSNMTVRACLVLDRLDEEDGFAPDEPGQPPSAGPTAEARFAFDDAELDALLGAGTSQDGFFLHPVTPRGTGSSLVPTCFPSYRILTT